MTARRRELVELDYMRQKLTPNEEEQRHDLLNEVNNLAQHFEVLEPDAEVERVLAERYERVRASFARWEVQTAPTRKEGQAR